MTATDEWNLAGIVLTGLGSCLGMFGIFKQTNGYYAFRSMEIFGHLRRLLWARVTKGKEAAIAQINAAATLAEKKGEDHSQSLIGLYCVFFGFFLQLFGSVLLVIAILH